MHFHISRGISLPFYHLNQIKKIYKITEEKKQLYKYIFLHPQCTKTVILKLVLSLANIPTEKQTKKCISDWVKINTNNKRLSALRTV